MKRKITFLVIGLAFVIFGCNKEEPEGPESPETPFSETSFVSKTPGKKNIILEEFTGIACGFCPDGHRIANQLAAANPGRFFTINIHTRSFEGSYPNFKLTTIFAADLVSQCGTSGAPMGTINRHLFSGYNILGMSRGVWKSTADQILAEDSYVNVAAKSTINRSKRELKITVEIYYTESSGISSNRLNIALLQNKILGPQNSMNTNPSQVEGAQYRHMHTLRHLITGQWGDYITKTSKGSLVKKEYTYKIPEKYGVIDCILDDLEIVVFVAEDTKEIITGTKSELTFE